MAGILMEETLNRQLCRLDLCRRIRKGRIEVSIQSGTALDRNLPDSEKSENMVDPEGVEIFGHLLQAGLPPGIVILGHFLPIVGREAPVLTFLAEVIRRCACGGVQIEQFRMPVGIGAVSTHTDREVSLEGNALRTGIPGNFRKLPVQMVLHPVVVFLLEGIPLRAEDSIFLKPELIVPGELPVGRCLHVLLSTGEESLADVLHLCLEDCRIVDFRKVVERLLFFPEGSGFLYSQALQVHEQRVKGE